MAHLQPLFEMVADEFGAEFRHFLEREVPDPDLRDKLAYAVSLIGERERPLLVHLSSSIAGLALAPSRALALSAELFISSALVGDDLVDGAESRWGKPTVWKRFGPASGLLVPEALHALANTALAPILDQEPQAGGAAVKAVVEMQRSFKDFFVWQHMESAMEGRSDFSEELCLQLAYWRTGRLLELCLALPAQLAGAEEGMQSALVAYGKAFGTAFQLRDDVIDYIGEEQLIGKPVMGDFRNGQPNIVTCHLLSRAPQNIRARALELWEQRRSEPQSDELLALAIEGGSVLHGVNVVRKLCTQAKIAATELPSSDEREALYEFAEWIGDLPVLTDEH